MKKFVKIICSMVIMCFCFINVIGCSCSKTLKTQYTINVSNEDDSPLDTKIRVRAVVTKKFREPVDTPCYDEDGILIENSEGISKCYTVDGEEFEKATYKADESAELQERYPIYVPSSGYEYPSSYTSDTFEVPKEKNYSLIYTFEIENKEDSDIYIKTFNIDQLLSGGLKAESYEKVTCTLPSNVIIEGNNEYYKIESDEKIIVKIQLKGLTNSDLFSKELDYLTLNLPIVIKK